MAGRSAALTEYGEADMADRSEIASGATIGTPNRVDEGVRRP